MPALRAIPRFPCLFPPVCLSRQDDAAIKRAWNVTISRHAFLTAVLVNDDTDKPQWGRLTEVDLARVMRWRNKEEKLDDVLTEAHSMPFAVEDKTLSLWRVELLPRDETLTVLLVMHHAIGDGIGALSVLDTFFGALNDPATPAVDASCLPRPLEQMVLCQPGLMLTMKTVLKALILPAWISRALGWDEQFYKGICIAPKDDNPEKTLVRSFQLDQKQTERLLTFARQEKLSLSALLYTSLASAVAQTLTGSPSLLAGGMAVNQRPDFSPKERDAHILANYACGFKSVVPKNIAIQPEKPAAAHSRAVLLAVAKDTDRQVKAPNMRRQGRDAVGFCRFIPAGERRTDSPYRYDSGWERFVRQMGEKHQRSTTFAISNLGVWRPSTGTERWKVIGAIFSGAVGAIAELVNLSTVSVDGRLFATLSWQEGTLEPAAIDHIRERLALYARGDWLMRPIRYHDSQSLLAPSPDGMDNDTKHSAYHTSAFNAAGSAIAHDQGRQVEAHHYCTHLRKDLHQCVIYDSDQPGARLIGIEYLVSEAIFRDLPDDEKRWWHSHRYEVGSGMLMLGTKSLVPNAVTDEAEQPAFLELQKTYGKTIHTWQIDKHPDLPLGPPALMLSFTKDGQVDEKLLKERDERMSVDTQKKREWRKSYLPDYQELEGCDQVGKFRLQLESLDAQ